MEATVTVNETTSQVTQLKEIKPENIKDDHSYNNKIEMTDDQNEYSEYLEEEYLDFDMLNDDELEDVETVENIENEVKKGQNDGLKIIPEPLTPTDDVCFNDVFNKSSGHVNDSFDFGLRSDDSDHSDDSNDSDIDDAKEEFYKQLNVKVKHEDGKGKKRKVNKMQTFGERYNFEIMLLDMEQKSKFRCAKCYQRFSSESAFKKHLLVHKENEGPHVCDVCDTRFRKKFQLDRHRLHHRIKYKCRDCKALCKNIQDARLHYEMHAKASEQIEQKSVNKIRKRSKIRAGHIRVKQGSMMCDICYEGFCHSQEMLDHKATVHENASTCDMCQTKFAFKYALEAHITALGSLSCAQGIRPCSACGLNLTTENQLQKHIATVHPPKTVIAQDNQCCQCKQQTIDNIKEESPKPEPEPETETKTPRTRSKSVASKINLPEIKKKAINVKNPRDLIFIEIKKGNKVKNNENIVIRTSKDQNKCLCHCHKDCAVKVKPVKKVKKDNKVTVKKEDSTPLVCRYCGKNRFQSMSKVREHEMIHTGEKPWKCRACPKKFRLKSLLEMHSTVHTGERAFRCDVCDKYFKTAPGRNRHRMIHTGERRYECFVCHKRYQTSSCLSVHVKTVHLKVPYPPSRVGL